MELPRAKLVPVKNFQHVHERDFKIAKKWRREWFYISLPEYLELLKNNREEVKRVLLKVLELRPSKATEDLSSEDIVIHEENYKIYARLSAQYGLEFAKAFAQKIHRALTRDEIRALELHKLTEDLLLEQIHGGMSSAASLEVDASIVETLDLNEQNSFKPIEYESFNEFEAYQIPELDEKPLEGLYRILTDPKIDAGGWSLFLALPQWLLEKPGENWYFYITAVSADIFTEEPSEIRDNFYSFIGGQPYLEFSEINEEKFSLKRLQLTQLMELHEGLMNLSEERIAEIDHLIATDNLSRKKVRSANHLYKRNPLAPPSIMNSRGQLKPPHKRKKAEK